MTYEIYPKVYRADMTQRVNVKLSDEIPTEYTVSVKIQPMESYGIEHTPIYHLLEEERYPFLEATREDDGSYSLE